MSNNSLLDVDESIITKNLLLPGIKEENDLEELLKNFNKPERPSVTIRPSPGSCVKAKTECGQKVFLNICLTTEIPAPEEISETQLLKLIEDETPSSYRIPMSIGQERMESDKSDKPAPTYDIAINTEFYKKCMEHKLFWVFLISVVIEGVSDKYDKRIRPEGYVVLKHRKALGKLQQHRIEKREVNNAMRKPLIQDLTGDNLRPTRLETETINLSKSALSAQSVYGNNFKNSRIPEYRILREPKEGTVEKLVGQFKVPNVLSSKDLAVDVGEDRIIVEAHRTGYLIDIFVPYSIAQENVDAALDTINGVSKLLYSCKLITFLFGIH
ncbi:PIH1 domain-containing protein 1 isoform X1 [Neodiprion pinetum]|uniref:PIH1 domain-containing protein 1 n=1 Tax=Neodiprion lecontei TaxID=441921 RepID=A0A6J0BXF1_NEOLC|nr:PIH1 domain-containing protein 1 isoform X1 [Neodiprion lecontei]XP_046475199.1 PIH1 domain-containing protein 1-like isoform X1 [Neodiprion pinetum]